MFLFLSNVREVDIKPPSCTDLDNGQVAPLHFWDIWRTFNLTFSTFSQQIHRTRTVMYSYVQLCTVMYSYVQLCTVMYSYLQLCTVIVVYIETITTAFDIYFYCLPSF